MAYTLTAKSQVTLPKAIREHLRVAPGDAVQYRIGADGTVHVEPVRAVRAADARRLEAAQARFAGLKGSGGRSGATSSDALMQLLRGYADDATDPGFASASGPAVAPATLEPKRKAAKPR